MLRNPGRLAGLVGFVTALALALLPILPPAAPSPAAWAVRVAWPPLVRADAVVRAVLLAPLPAAPAASAVPPLAARAARVVPRQQAARVGQLPRVVRAARRAAAAGQVDAVVRVAWAAAAMAAEIRSRPTRAARMAVGIQSVPKQAARRSCTARVATVRTECALGFRHGLLSCHWQDLRVRRCERPAPVPRRDLGVGREFLVASPKRCASPQPRVRRDGVRPSPQVTHPARRSGRQCHLLIHGPRRYLGMEQRHSQVEPALSHGEPWAAGLARHGHRLWARQSATSWPFREQHLHGLGVGR